MPQNEEKCEKTNEFPGISIIVAVYNEEKFIRNCIESLLQQTYPGETEIIISDGGSTDDTCKIVREMQKLHPQIKLVHNKKKYQ